MELNKEVLLGLGFFDEGIIDNKQVYEIYIFSGWFSVVEEENGYIACFHKKEYKKCNKSDIWSICPVSDVKKLVHTLMIYVKHEAEKTLEFSNMCKEDGIKMFRD